MAFWGVEVKPGKPFTHKFDRGRGRLHISQATLGLGSSTTKSLVQCNVGNKSPVFLCALLPDKTESCHLDVEFEEDDEVIFSVIGPRSVHLTGYFLGSGRHSDPNDDTESYGEDIGNTESDASDHSSDEDGYDDSFIDDGNPDVFPTSPVSNDGVVGDEMLDTKKLKERKGRQKRRLKKKYQSRESDDHCSPRKNIISCFSGIESSDDDKLPISSLDKSRKAKDDGPLAKTEDEGMITINQTNQADAVLVDGESQRVSFEDISVVPEDGFELKKERRERPSVSKSLEADILNSYDTLEDKLQHTEEDTHRVSQDLLVNRGVEPNHSLLPSNELGVENHTKSKKKRKERTKEWKTPESGGLKDCRALQDKAEDQKPATDKGSYELLPFSETGSENGGKQKKRRKECAAEGISVEGSANDNNVLKEDTTKQKEDKSEDDHPTSEQDQKFSDIKSVDIDSNQVADGDQPGDKKSKKKKKKSKNQEYKENMDINEPLLPLEGKNRSSKVFEDKNVEAKPSQTRTLSNGLIIEDLGSGKPDGKVAAPGKKITVHYVGKLKENGQIFDSNIDSSPFKFRLGADDIIEGWNVGLNGMRVGDKRRLIIPPSMGYGSQGATGENIPPNSWLVYEVEVMGVR
ncbi:hypothetical protein C3L33_21731, partial [Rhododendron williamsianum]